MNEAKADYLKKIGKIGLLGVAGATLLPSVLASDFSLRDPNGNKYKISGTNTGDQDLQSVTDLDNTTTNSIEVGGSGSGQSIYQQGVVVNEAGGNTTGDSFRVETGLLSDAFTIDAVNETSEFKIPITGLTPTTDYHLATKKYVDDTDNLLVPYTGATTNVDLGSNDLTATRLYGQQLQLDLDNSSSSIIDINGTNITHEPSANTYMSSKNIDITGSQPYFRTFYTDYNYIHINSPGYVDAYGYNLNNTSCVGQYFEIDIDTTLSSDITWAAGERFVSRCILRDDETDNGIYTLPNTISNNGMKFNILEDRDFLGTGTETYYNTGLAFIIVANGDGTVSNTLNKVNKGLNLSFNTQANNVDSMENYGVIVGMSDDATESYGLYINGASGANHYAYYNVSSGANNLLGNDNIKSFMGTAKDSSIYYDGTDLVINPAEVGAGHLSLSSRKITSLADGTADTDAVNKGQMDIADALLVPYTGATTNVDLGTNSLTTEIIEFNNWETQTLTADGQTIQHNNYPAIFVSGEVPRGTYVEWDASIADGTYNGQLLTIMLRCTANFEGLDASSLKVTLTDPQRAVATNLLLQGIVSEEIQTERFDLIWDGTNWKATDGLSSNDWSGGGGAWASGVNTTASGEHSSAEGRATTASGKSAHSEGNQTTASGENAHVEGFLSVASNFHAHAEGSQTTASGNYGHSEGNATTASGTSSHAEGWSTNATFTATHAEGRATTASGFYAHSGGFTTTAEGDKTFVHGYNLKATGDDTALFGYSTSLRTFTDAKHFILSEQDLWIANDNYKSYFGTSKDTSLYYDGTDFIIDTSLVTPSDLLLDCGTNKTLELQHHVTDDVQIDIGAVKLPPAQAATIVLNPADDVGLAVHFSNASTESIHFNMQSPHARVDESDIEFHMHVTPGSSTNTGNVRMQLDYDWQNINGTYGGTTTVYKTFAMDGTAHKHQYEDIATISGTGMSCISSIICCKLTRLGSDALDTFTGDVYAIGMDFHVKKDTIGSRQETTK